MGTGKGIVIFVFHTATLSILVIPSAASQYRDLYWNTSNPIFQINNIMEINRGVYPIDFDTINFKCPLYQKSTPVEHTEKYVIYSVTKQEYERCTIMDYSPRIFVICNKPYEPTIYRIPFRWFTPTPGGFEVHRGDLLYLMSNSHKWNSEHDRVSSLCLNHNMRMTLKVYDGINYNDTRPEDDLVGSRNAHDKAGSGVPASTVQETSTTTTAQLSGPSDLPNREDAEEDTDRRHLEAHENKDNLLTSETLIRKLALGLAILGLIGLTAVSLVLCRLTQQLSKLRAEDIEKNPLHHLQPHVRGVPDFVKHGAAGIQSQRHREETASVVNMHL